MKNMGVAGPDSSNEVAKSGALPATYWLPSFSSTKSLPGKKYTHVYPSQNCETEAYRPGGMYSRSWAW